MSLESVFTKHAPAPRPVYSQAIVANNFVFCSGQLPKDPATNKLLDADVETCTVSVKMVLLRPQPLNQCPSRLHSALY